MSVQPLHTPAAATPASFADLAFNAHPNHGSGEQARMFWPNGYGVSVIRSPYSYGGPAGLYELAVFVGDADSHELTYDTPIADDVEGHLSPDAVSRLMAAVAALPPTASAGAV